MKYPCLLQRRHKHFATDIYNSFNIELEFNPELSQEQLENSLINVQLQKKDGTLLSSSPSVKLENLNLSYDLSSSSYLVKLTAPRDANLLDEDLELQLSLTSVTDYAPISVPLAIKDQGLGFIRLTDTDRNEILSPIITAEDGTAQQIYMEFDPKPLLSSLALSIAIEDSTNEIIEKSMPHFILDLPDGSTDPSLIFHLQENKNELDDNEVVIRLASTGYNEASFNSPCSR